MTRLGSVYWTDLDDASTMVLLVPLGSTEQHGPHLPLDTDTRIAEYLCAAVAAARDDLVVAPALAFGSSGEHQGFAGTISIGTDALHLVLVELCRSASHTFDRIVLVNGHGGNAAGVTSAVELLQAEGRKVSAWWPALPDGDAHAGRTETSIMLVIDAAAVSMEQAEVGNTEPIAELLPALRAAGLAGATANGILGDATTASRAHGAGLVAELTRQLSEHVTYIRGES